MCILVNSLKRSLFCYLTVLLYILLSIPSFSQSYPVHASIQLIPPYSLYLTDYYSLSREKMVITLLNRDLARPSLEVRLRLSITCGSAAVVTKDVALLPTFTLEPGIPLRLSGDDLAPFLARNNLSGSLPSGRLPEGQAHFCVEVLEAYTRRSISGKQCSMVWLSWSKPPLLNLPNNNESKTFHDPTTILFQWVPQHRAIALVDYEFVLKELVDNGAPPQSAFAYSPTIHTETLHGTSFPYNSALYAPLQPGKTYAWQVRARARDGIDEISLFENNGYSEVRWFKLVEDCSPPTALTYSARYNKVTLSWLSQARHTSFEVASRRTGGDRLPEWVTQTVSYPPATLNLKMGETYQVRVGAECFGTTMMYSEPIEIVMPEVDPVAAARCGKDPSNKPLNPEKRYDLKEGDRFMASGCEMYIKRLTSNANGVYNGEGVATLTIFDAGEIPVAVTFNNVEVNVDNELVGGEIVSKSSRNFKTLTNLDEIYEGGGTAGKVKTGATAIDYKVAFTIDGPEAFNYDKTTNTLTVQDDQGNTQTIPINTAGYTAGQNDKTGIDGGVQSVFPMTVKDKSGTVYQIEEEITTDEEGHQIPTGKVTATVIGKDQGELEKAAYSSTAASPHLATVTFSNSANSKYAIDTLPAYFEKTLLIANAYQPKLTPNYAIPYKFLPEGGSDEVQASITIKDDRIDPDKVVFRTPNGTVYKATRSGNTYTFTVTAGPVNDVQEVYAFGLLPGAQTYSTLGKLNVATYKSQQHKLTLVAVNNNTLNAKEVETYLNRIYNPYGVTWTVSQDNAFTYTLSDLDTKGSNLFSAYTSEMNALNAAYQTYKQDRFDDSSVYLFLLNSGEMKGEPMAGDMPRGKQFGYIFTQDQPKETRYRTI